MDIHRGMHCPDMCQRPGPSGPESLCRPVCSCSAPISESKTGKSDSTNEIPRLCSLDGHISHTQLKIERPFFGPSGPDAEVDCCGAGQSFASTLIYFTNLKIFLWHSLMDETIPVIFHQRRMPSVSGSCSVLLPKVASLLPKGA